MNYEQFCDQEIWSIQTSFGSRPVVGVDIARCGTSFDDDGSDDRAKYKYALDPEWVEDEVSRRGYFT
jgi:hypothetical protein